ncbi:MAG: CRISPR-associated protein Cas4 [Nitrososphaerota archaeon]
MTEELDRYYMLSSDKVITGTLLWYYAVCKREVWLMSHRVTPDEEHYMLEFGRVTHETFYTRMRREVEVEGMKIDVIQGRDGVVCEVKTSSRFLEATRLQLGYYLLRLEEMGANTSGMILVPRERKRIQVVLDEGLRSKIKTALHEIKELCLQPLPPPPVRISFCKRCAYHDFCWG